MVLRMLLACLLAVTAVTAQLSGLVQQYCALQNTAEGYQGVYYQWQSNGACKTQCQDNYAYAIVQGTFCWCSNYTPSSSTDVSKCSDKCPGYPSDLCGNVASGLYGYIALNKQPIGIYGADKTTSAAPSSSTSTSSTSQPSAESTSNSAATSTSATAMTSAVVVTVSGAVVTQTITSTPITNSPQDAGAYTVQQQGLSAGAIAGIVIGVVAGLLALLLAAFLLYRRKQQREKEEAVAAAAAGRAMAEKKPPPRRNTSVLSRSGLLGGGAYDENANPFDEPTAGTASQRASMLFGGAAAAEATSPLGSSHSDGSNRRHSKPMVYDQRLNPSALFGAHDNSSRVSMQDGADYSRTLGVTNPDPRASWESRVSR